jgi:hypothetical protein
MKIKYGLYEHINCNILNLNIMKSILTYLFIYCKKSSADKFVSRFYF